MISAVKVGHRAARRLDPPEFPNAIRHLRRAALRFFKANGIKQVRVQRGRICGADIPRRPLLRVNRAGQEQQQGGGPGSGPLDHTFASFTWPNKPRPIAR